MHSNAPVTTVEIFRDDEEEQAQRAADNFVNVIKETTTTYAARGAHAKGHACVKAYFKVSDSINQEFRHGVFQTPGKVFKSWIRFSNGGSDLADSHDAKKDSRGMALKLINMEEDSNNSSQQKIQAQDFLMHNSPIFFSGNVDDYNQLVESDNKTLSFFSSLNPFKWRLRELRHVFDTLSPPPYSPLWDDYFSNTAYKLGPRNIKFSSQSCVAAPDTTNQNQSDADFLRLTMTEELANKEACFRFKVQLQDIQKYMPIENPSIEWKPSDSPYITVATIKIPAQSFDSDEQRQFCEDLSFTPWNALEAHRPIGELNRIRKLVYAVSSRYRHARNKTQVPKILDW
jgi:catalase